MALFHAARPLKYLSVGLTLLVIAGAPFSSVAQPPAQTPRIGVLSGGSPATGAARHEALRQGLRELGYVEGKNIVRDLRYAEGRSERLPALAAELVRLNPAVVVTSGDQPIRAARQASRTIPIVVALASDLVGPGHAASLAHPGGNVTGITTIGPEVSVKRMELLKAAVPQVSRVGVLWNSTNVANAAILKEMEAAAPALGLQLVSLAVPGAGDLQAALRTALRERTEALIAFADTVLLTHRVQIIDFAAKH